MNPLLPGSYDFVFAIVTLLIYAIPLTVILWLFLNERKQTKLLQEILEALRK